MLTHPAYAGAYVYGRTRQRRRRRRRRGAAGAPRQAAARRMGGAHPRPSPADSWTGIPSWPTSTASLPTPAPRPTSPAPGPCGRAAPCCRGWPPAAPAAANSPSTTTAGQDHAWLLLHRHRHARRGQGTRHLRIGGATIDAAVAEAFLAAMARRRCRPAWPPPSSSRTAMTPPWHSSAARSSRPATTLVAPSAATAPSTPTTGWSPADWKPNGTPRCRPSPTPRPNSPAAKPPGRKP